MLAISTRQRKRRLFCVVDTVTGYRFLLDTGAEVSILPGPRLDRPRKQHTLPLQALNSSPVATYAQRSLTLNLGLRHAYTWLFIVVDIRQTSLRAYLIGFYKSFRDIHSQRLNDFHSDLA